MARGTFWQAETKQKQKTDTKNKNKKNTKTKNKTNFGRRTGS